MALQSEKYGELLQAIADLIVQKDGEIDELHEEIKNLKDMLTKAEQEKGNK